MVAVIYARYSDSKQTEQSIEGQLKVVINTVKLMAIRYYKNT